MHKYTEIEYKVSMNVLGYPENTVTKSKIIIFILKIVFKILLNVTNTFL